MKPLIRPFLFAVARLGLFLAVAAWIVGQWRFASMNLGHFGAGLSASSVHISWEPRKSRYNLFVNEGAEVEALTAYTNTWFRRLRRLPGIALRTHSAPWLIVNHWLIVSSLTLTNIAIHFIYRKRPEIQTCEN